MPRDESIGEMRDEEDLDENDDDGEEPEDVAPPPPPPVAKRAPKRSRGLGAPPQKFQRSSNEADTVWDELCQWLPTQNLGPGDISISVKRVQPPSPNGGPIVFGRAFGGEAVDGAGQETPGSALMQYLLRNFHLASGDRRAATYQVIFGRKSNGAQLSSGLVNLPAADECINLMTAPDQGAHGVGAPMRMPAMPPQAWAGPPAGPQQGMAGLPQQPWFPPQPSPMNAELQELAYLRGTLAEALAAAREGRQPVIAPPPAGVAGPPGMTDHDVDRIAARVAMMMGGPPRTAVAVAAPPPPPPPTIAAPPPPPDGFETMIRKSIVGMAESMFKASVASVEKNVKASMGFGAPPSVADEPENEMPAPIVEDPANAIPWTVSPVGAEWADKRPMMVAMDKKSNSIDVVGTLMANPVIAEKAMDLANGIGEAVRQFVQSKVSAAVPTAQPQIVHQIPAGAVHAGVAAPKVIESVPPPPPGPPEGGGWQAP